MTEAAPLRLPEPAALGPFVVHERVGQGGMGDVWKGLHVRQNVPVAIKVLGEDYADAPDFLDAFHAEVEAVARLRHPGIVMVFDHGVIPAATAALSAGLLREGHPYLVMELATGGTLQSDGTPPDWITLRRTLLEVLDALAHAHARGVIHRDVKPANVLICSDADSRPGLKLSDFGLAAAGERRRAERLVGTPAFMAPEQCDGRWRDHGPWTDLYAFGCMAYALSSGALPFDDTNPMQIVLQQFADEPPPLEPLFPVPDGFEAWLLRLMAKSPGDRFRWAADAAFALRELGHPSGAGARHVFVPGLATQRERLIGSGSTRHGPAHAAPTRRFSAGLAREASATSFAAGRGATQVNLNPLLHTSIPPLPRTWRRAGAGARGESVGTTSMQLIGVGLGLFGLRTIPHIGREEERDRLWQRLLEVQRDRRARVCVLLGEPGTGKSRLALSIAQRAHEVGAAQVLHGTHGATVAGLGDGVPRMLSSFLRCLGLSRREVRGRLQGLLGEGAALDVDALTELLHPATPRDVEEGARVIRFSSPEERYASARRLLEHLAAERPLVVCLDDVQWGLDALGFVEHVLDAQAQHPSPMLFLLTAREDALGEQALERARLDALLEHAETERVELRPLPERDHAALVSELLGLEGELADDVARRTAGNPLFAVQLVGDWVERGVLEVGVRGFRLRAGEQAVLPDDIHELWRSRLTKLLDGRPPSATTALELAAALGVDVRTEEWSAVCELASTEVPEDLLGALFHAGLARRATDGWSFAHSMFRESIERSAREARRWARHNKRCADMIERLHPPEQRGRAERMGRHLLATAELNRAIDLLLQGARERFEVSEYKVAVALLDRRDAALERLRVPASDLRWSRGWLLRSDALRMQGSIEEAAIWAQKAEARVREAGSDEDLARALISSARLAMDQHRFDDATRGYREALLLFGRLGDQRGRADCAWGLGVLSLTTGNIDEGRALLESTRALADSVDYTLRVADTNHQLARIAKLAGDLDEAEARVRDAWRAYERIGSRTGMAYCLNGLGELHRARGELSQAESSYRQALAMHEASGSESLICRINLALVLLERREYGEARRVLEAVAEEFARRNAGPMLGVTRVALLPCLAWDGDWRPFDEYLDGAPSQLGQLVDPDVAWPAQLAGELAMSAGHYPRARRAFGLALEQWRSLGREHEAEHVAALAATLD